MRPRNKSLSVYGEQQGQKRSSGSLYVAESFRGAQVSYLNRVELRDVQKSLRSQLPEREELSRTNLAESLNLGTPLYKHYSKIVDLVVEE